MSPEDKKKFVGPRGKLFSTASERLSPEQLKKKAEKKAEKLKQDKIKQENLHKKQVEEVHYISEPSVVVFSHYAVITQSLRIQFAVKVVSTHSLCS